MYSEHSSESEYLIDDTNETVSVGESSLRHLSLSSSSDLGLRDENLEAPKERQSEVFIKAVDGKFFKLLQPEGDETNKLKIVVSCVQCKPRNVEIKGYNTSTSNFKSHLKRRHGDELLNDFKKYIEHPNKKQKTSFLDPNKQGSCSTSRDRQKEFDDCLTKFIIHTMVPLKVVEDPTFIDLLQCLKMREQNLSLFSRRTLGRRINALFEEKNSQIKQELQHVAWLCSTADIWSSKSRSFLGVTLHWIHEDSLKRKSVAIACRRFNNTHSFDRIADILDDIYTEFGINQSKIIAAVTDNGSNFVKAFKVFGVKESNIECIDDSDDKSVLNLETESEADSESEDEEIKQKRKIILPSHLRCCAHTLSLCVTSDATKAIKNDSYLSVVHSNTIKKCNSLWKATGRPKSSEIVKEILTHTLSRPGETRWNSLYDSLKQIIKIKEKSGQLFRALNLKNSLKEEDFIYLEEHVTCTEPIAKALDIMQGENCTYYGIMLPCLLALRKKLIKLSAQEWVYCKPLADSLLESVDKRFHEYFVMQTAEAEKAAIAALSYPRFKKEWLSCVDPSLHGRLLNIFKEKVSDQFATTTTTMEQNQQEIAKKNDDHFFDFGTETGTEISSKIEMQILHFFNDTDKNLEMLNRFPEIKRVFIKFNTALPSSAPVERLFSYATMVNLPKSNKLSDANFEKRVILKANLNIITQ